MAAALMLLLTACQETGTRGGTPGPEGQRLYDLIMNEVSEYHRLPEPKALAACIHHPGTGSSRYRVMYVFASYTSEGSDAPVFIGTLMNSARGNCQTWRSKNGESCDCMPVDSNGTNVLAL